MVITAENELTATICRQLKMDQHLWSFIINNFLKKIGVLRKK